MGIVAEVRSIFTAVQLQVYESLDYGPHTYPYFLSSNYTIINSTSTSMGGSSKLQAGSM